MIEQYNRKVLHSVVETSNKDNQKVILDYTFNILMPKDSYKKLTNFEELNVVEGETLENDFEKILKFFDQFGHKEYLLFRDELIRDLEKNEKHLKQDEER